MKWFKLLYAVLHLFVIAGILMIVLATFTGCQVQPMVQEEKPTAVIQMNQSTQTIQPTQPTPAITQTVQKELVQKDPGDFASIKILAISELVNIPNDLVWIDYKDRYTEKGVNEFKITYEFWGPSSAYSCMEVEYNGEYDLLGCGGAVLVDKGSVKIYFKASVEGGEHLTYAIVEK